MNSEGVTNSVNVGITSVAMFLIIMPEPCTTFIGLAMLSILKKNKPKTRCRRISYHGDVSYADIVHNKFAFHDAAVRKGFLRPAQFAMEPGIDNTHIWKQRAKTKRQGSLKSVSYEAARGELTASSCNIPSVFYCTDNRQAYRASIQPKKTITAQHGLPYDGCLPAARPNLPDYYYDPSAWKAARNNTVHNSEGYVPGAQRGQLPLPWPNMPRSKFTPTIHRATRTR